MIWNTKQRKEELLRNIQVLELSVKTLTQRKEDLEQLIEAERKNLDDIRNQKEEATLDAIYACEPALDLQAMRAFSVERTQHSSGHPVTVVGYIRPNNVLGEWILHCSVEQHAKIVEEFKKIVSNRNEELHRLPF